MLDNKFIVELVNKSYKEIYDIGVNYLNTDDEKCINILKTIVEEVPISGFIIGIAHFNLRNSELSSNYFIDAINKVDEFDLSEEFVGIISEIIATNEINLGKADDRTIRMFFNVLDINQSTTALIKLSYLILSKNLNHLKEFALENISIAIDFNQNEDNEFSKIAGFHIICCVLLWNDKFHEAEKHHVYFLKDNNNFLKHYENLVEGYITLALAKNDVNFISNLILDFPHLKTMYSGLFDA